MQYRKLGPRVSEEVSALSFGCMRLPTQQDKSIDRDATFEMLRYAIDRGVNYLDTAWPYHGGESENVVGEFLSNGYRDKVLLATKMPMWKVKDPAELDEIFAEQLKKLQTDRIDFYLLHGLNEDRWRLAREIDVMGWGERMKAEGKIRYFGFSFHDAHSVFVDIVDGYAGWDFCQIQYNYMNETIQAGTAGLEHAARNDVGVVIMEPLLGGDLARPPEAVRAVFAGNEAAGSRSPVEYALRWLWDKKEVGTILSGMSSMEQVVENVEYAGRSSVACLLETERPMFEQAREIYESLRPIPCTACRYCMPCPNGVEIPDNFRLLNEKYMYDNEKPPVWRYNNVFGEDQRASACVECGECEPKCPQDIPIIDSLKRVSTELGQEEATA